MTLTVDVFESFDEVHGAGHRKADLQQQQPTGRGKVKKVLVSPVSPVKQRMGMTWTEQVLQEKTKIYHLVADGEKIQIHIFVEDGECVLNAC